MLSIRSGFAAAGFTLAVMLAPPVQAQAARDKVLANMVEVLKAAGAKDVTYGAVEGDDAKFTVKDIEVTVKDKEEEVTISADSATFENAKPTPEGGYTADAISLSGFSVEDSKTSMSADAFKILKYVGQPAAQIKAGNLLGDRFERLEIADIEFEGEKDITVPVKSVVITSGAILNGIPTKGSLKVSGLVIPIDEKNPDFKEIAALGYKELAIDFGAAGSYDDKAQKILVEDFSLSGKDAGAVKLALSFGNVTADALKQLQAAQNDSAKQVEILQSFTIEGASLRIDNASVVDRVLDAKAKEAGQSRADFVTSMTSALPILLAAVGNPTFEKKVADAVTAFLKAPKSLTLSVKPAAPVPVAQVVGTVLVAPQTLPEVLAVDVTANQ